jgi:hypothetical protein
MDPRKWLAGLLGLAVWLTLPELLGPASAAERKPNILWLIAEDLGTEIGCYGGQQVWTPNLDKMAADGVRYTRCFTTAPVC